jgi:2-oxoglutarate dehydrogenase E1 component
LLDARTAKKRHDVALVRLEQLFPLPKRELEELFAKYVDAELVWAQEEPRNMGAYGHLLLHLPQARDFRVASRRFYGAPAAGSSTRSKRRHQEIIEYVFDKTKDNMR